MGMTINYTSCLFSLEGQPIEETSSHTFPFHTRLLTAVFENFENSEYFGDVETRMVLLLRISMLLNVFQVLFKVKIPPRDLFQGWIVLSGRVSGIV